MLHRAMAVSKVQSSVPPSDGRVRAGDKFLFAGKVVVSAACLWYVLRNVSLRETFQALPNLDFRWLALAVFAAAVQIPLTAVRWQRVVHSLTQQPGRLTYVAATNLTAMYAFFSQVMPGLMSEGIRVWILVRFGYSWRDGLSSVAIDRGVGVGMLGAFVIVILSLPTPLATLLGYREIIVTILSIALIVGVAALLLTTHFTPLLQRWRYTYWLGSFISDTRRVLLGPWASVIFGSAFAVHLATIIVIWSVGSAEGLVLPVFGCAVLFGVVVGVALLPITISGWGVREITVVSLLGAYGIPPEKALLLSLCYGLVFVIVALPGAFVWMLYPLSGKASSAAF